MSGVFGYQGQLGIDTVDPITKIYDFQREDFKLEEEIVYTGGLRGRRSRAGERNRTGIRRAHGPIKLQPTSQDWVDFLPWILGGTFSTNVITVADTIPARFVTIDRIRKVFKYAGVCVDKATINARQEQQIVELDLDLIGIDETLTNSGTFPGSTYIDTKTFPYRFYDTTTTGSPVGVLTIGGTTVTAKNVQIVIDNVIDKERFFNSQVLVTVQPTDRHVTVNLDIPYGDWNAIYGTGSAQPGLAVVVGFVFGAAQLQFALNAVFFPRISPTWKDERGEEFLTIQGIAYSNQDPTTHVFTPEITVTALAGP